MAEKEDEKRPGPTGDFPDGKLNQEDEGGLNIAIQSRPGKVILRFGIPITWIGLNPGDAFKLSAMLREKAVHAIVLGSKKKGN